MRRWTEEPRKQARIEIIPMIDVMMFLLVFFVLISINVIPALGIKTTLPQSSQPEDNRAVKNVIITLAPSGEMQLDGAAVTADELTQRLTALHAADPHVNVIINGDRTVEMQRLVDALDAVKAAGIDALSMATKKRD
ncbi:ExbD/TolR family protein [Aliidongia dinghuensis]|nr:biopolymer transporter ExbD [Aliidongia dinghuensis]